MMSEGSMEFVMRYRYLLLLTMGLCAGTAAQGVIPASSSDHWSKLAPAPAATAASGYRNTLSAAANDAQRFNFNQGPVKDQAPADQSPIRVIINNGHGPNVNCVPMGPGGACH
jgi:hypothetical protein